MDIQRGCRTGIYVRISDDKTGAGIGVESQEEDCRRLADSLGVTVVEVYSDNDVSAYSGKPRPDYKRMLDDIAAGTIGAVIAWHPDRLHRAPKELEAYIDVCQPRGVASAFVRAGHYDLSTATGRMIARQIGVQARYESELKSERVKAARAHNAERGRYNGGNRPFGYARDGITVVPDEAAEVVKAANAIAGGESLRSVVRDLNARGIRTSRDCTWTGQSLRQVLMAPRIAGLSAYHGEPVGTGEWSAIIDEPLWRAVCAVLTNPARRTTNHGAGAVNWLGSGLYRCGVCGEPALRVNRSGSKSAPAYRCMNRDGRKHVSRVAPNLDRYVENLVVERLSTPGLVDKLLTRDDSTDAAALRAELIEIAEDKEKLGAALGRKEIDLSMAMTASQEYSRREAEIADLLAGVGWRSPLHRLAGGNVRDLWFGTDTTDPLPLATRRAILNAVVDITVMPQGKRSRVGSIDPESVGVEWKVAG